MNFELQDWMSKWLRVLTDAGLDQTRAMSELYKRHGKGNKIDLATCPKQAGQQWLLANGYLPAR